MVKGVSKNVIEIADTGSEMFERAILFLRPQAREKSPEHIDESARKFLGGLRVRRRWFPLQKPAAALLKYGSAMSFGAAIAWLLFRMY